MAGDTVKWTIPDLSDYPIAEAWALSYALRSASGSLDVTATVADGRHNVTLTATQTGAMPAGVWRWHRLATKGAERYTVATGWLTVLSVDPDTALETELVEVQNAIREIQKTGTAAYSINGRATTHVDLPALHRRAAHLVEAIRRKNGGAFLRTVSYGFARD